MIIATSICQHTLQTRHQVHLCLLLVNGTDNTPADNLVTDHGDTLSRVLFYDQTLSANATISCASCHQAKNGFSDFLHIKRGF